ncbi:MAG: hypothetical protein ACRYGR_08745 [Janthinobacterium lividum]
MIKKLPICVDLDGTLLRTDVLSEALIVYIIRHPWRIFNVLFWFAKGRSYLKKKIADIIDLDISVLPVNQQIVDLSHQYKSQGHQILLVTAAPHKYGVKAAAHFDFFDDVMTSVENRNLRSQEKAKALTQRFGEGQFIYMGNSAHDLPVWRHGDKIIAINTPFWVLKKVFTLNKPYVVLEEGLLKGREIFNLIFQYSSHSKLYKSIPLIVLGLISVGCYFWTHDFLLWNFVSKILALILFLTVLKINLSLKTFVDIRHHQTLSNQSNIEPKTFNDPLAQALIQGNIPLGFIIQLDLACAMSILILMFCF